MQPLPAACGSLDCSPEEAPANPLSMKQKHGKLQKKLDKIPNYQTGSFLLLGGKKNIFFQHFHWKKTETLVNSGVCRHFAVQPGRKSFKLAPGLVTSVCQGAEVSATQEETVSVKIKIQTKYCSLAVYQFVLYIFLRVLSDFVSSLEYKE